MPIDQSKDWPCPKDDGPLWRYMDFPKYVSLLESSSLYFNRLDKFEDKHEGYLSPEQLETIITKYNLTPTNKWNEQLLKDGLRNMLQATKKMTFASCWTGADHESPALWHQYIKSGVGVAIRTTLGAMKKAWTAKDIVYPAKVQYTNYLPEELDKTNPFRTMIYKRKHFDYEREVRLLWSMGANTDLLIDEGVAKYDTFVFNMILDGRMIRIDLGELIQEVVVMPKLATWLFDAVRGVTERYKIRCNVRSSNLYDDPMLVTNTNQIS